MLTYHQCGHNVVWNLNSLQEDGAGEGMIISPVNIPSDKIQSRFPAHVLARSWLDPQFYLPDDSKGQLGSYPFFPSNVLGQFTTTAFEDHAVEIALQCLQFQAELGLRYLVIPTRYFEDLPVNYLDQVTGLFVEPFLSAYEELGPEAPLLLTVIAKPLHLEEGPARDELLSWATAYPEIAGIYLIFHNNFYSKQIKDPAYLVGQLRLIQDFRENGLEVHIGYAGLEGLLLSLADPTSVSMGSYENLRSFGVQRLESSEPTTRQGPRPRVYSGKLLQWIEDSFLPPVRQLVPDWRQLFDDSPYKDYLLDVDSTLNFQRSEVYKHYFFVFSRQVEDLPPQSARADHLRSQVLSALGLFEGIRSRGVYLDSDSDQSHLPSWMNAISMFEAG